ncbi:hypothetical protein HOC13_04030 [Candidatus Woesearchaeota archaeon]|jgi:hypothetical protein|nr:hypothetical protein [Candidatus Woesearchaeota archaeon]
MATLVSGYLTYKGVDSFFGVLEGTASLNDAVDLLKDYVAGGTQQTVEQAKVHLNQGYQALTNHWHILPLGTDVSELSEIVREVENLNPAYVEESVIPLIDDVRHSYSGPGNCPIVKVLGPVGLCAISVRKTVTTIHQGVKDKQDSSNF